jgi:hypothetical protein
VAALQGIVAAPLINVMKEHFDPISLPTGEFDLVIASHSLYHACDSRGNDPVKIGSELIGPILSRLSSDGRLVLILASQRGRSYRFKTTVLNSYFGESVRDASAEVIADALAHLHCGQHKVTIDNVFDLSKNNLLSHAEDKDRDILDWLGYFLRIDVGSMDRILRATLIDVLKYYTEVIDELPEEAITRFIALKTLPLTRQSMILRHKVVVFVVTSVR